MTSTFYSSGGHMGLKGLNCGVSQVSVATLHISVLSENAAYVQRSTPIPN